MKQDPEALRKAEEAVEQEATKLRIEMNRSPLSVASREAYREAAVKRELALQENAKMHEMVEERMKTIIQKQFAALQEIREKTIEECCETLAELVTTGASSEYTLALQNAGKILRSLSTTRRE